MVSATEYSMEKPNQKHLYRKKEIPIMARYNIRFSMSLVKTIYLKDKKGQRTEEKQKDTICLS